MQPTRVVSAESGGGISVDEAALIGEYNRRQACRVLESIQEAGLEISSSMQRRMAEALCW